VNQLIALLQSGLCGRAEYHVLEQLRILHDLLTETLERPKKQAAAAARYVDASARPSRF
jgi:hypothetical protein